MSDAKRLLLLDGPNLDQFGARDPAVYGSETLEDMVQRSRVVAEHHGWSHEHVQSASESELVATIHAARERCAAIVINGGAFTHYSWAIHDALQIFGGPVVELHVSQVAAREPWRHTSVISPVAAALIAGLGAWGYEVATEAAIRFANK